MTTNIEKLLLNYYLMKLLNDKAPEYSDFIYI